MSDLKQVAYCGIYCGLCGRCNRIPKQASDLLNTLKGGAIEFWGPFDPNFQEFWDFLKMLAGKQSSCRGGTCGNPDCSVKACITEKGIDACPFCDEYPCKKITDIDKKYIMLISDGKRMKEIGIDKWIDEQERRKATGFTYRDIMYPDVMNPDEPNKKQLQVEIKNLPEIHVACIQYTGSSKENPDAFSNTLAKLMNWAKSKGLINFPDTKILAYTPNQSGKIDRNYACITVPADTPVESEIEKLAFPSGKYAVAKFELVPGYDALFKAWNSIFNEWMPESGHEPDNRPSYTVFLNDSKDHPEGLMIVELYISIKPK